MNTYRGKKRGMVLRVSTAEASAPVNAAPEGAPPRPGSDVHIVTTRLRRDDPCGCAWCLIPED